MTERVKLITDSACDMRPEDEARYQIEILPFAVNIDGTTYLSRRDFTAQEFYTRLEASEELPSTSQITPFVFAELYERVWREGYTDLIYCSINSHGSATYNNAVSAVQTFYEAFPRAREELTIHLVDSGSYTIGYGYGVVEAAKQLEAGVPAAEAAAALQDWCDHSASTFVTYSLKYAAKSGRIPTVTAVLGTALGIKPMLQVHDHEITTVAKLRGEKKILSSIADYVLEDMEPDSPYIILCGSDPQIAEDMRSMMVERTGREPLYTNCIGPEIAINAGPQLTGVTYRKK